MISNHAVLVPGSHAAFKIHEGRVGTLLMYAQNHGTKNDSRTTLTLA